MPEMTDSSLTMQFHLQRIRYKAFVSSQLCFENSKRLVQTVLDITVSGDFNKPDRGSQWQIVKKQTYLLSGSPGVTVDK